MKTSSKYVVQFWNDNDRTWNDVTNRVEATEEAGLRAYDTQRRLRPGERFQLIWRMETDITPSQTPNLNRIESTAPRRP